MFGEKMIKRIFGILLLLCLDVCAQEGTITVSPSLPGHPIRFKLNLTNTKNVLIAANHQWTFGDGTATLRWSNSSVFHTFPILSVKCSYSVTCKYDYIKISGQAAANMTGVATARVTVDAFVDNGSTPGISPSMLTDNNNVVYTTNWVDNGNIYGYILNPAGTQIELFVNGVFIKTITDFGIAKKIFADNNRICILGTDNTIKWYTLCNDRASWSETLQLVLSYCIDDDYLQVNPTLPEVPVFDGGVLTNAYFLPPEPTPEPTDVSDIFSFTTKPFGSFMDHYVNNFEISPDQYYYWTITAHTPSRWNNLLDWNKGDPVYKRDGINVNDIVDIAVGYWPQTVVTFYALTKDGYIWWLDEEPIMRHWKKIEYWKDEDGNNHLITGVPPVLDLANYANGVVTPFLTYSMNSKVVASNSVVGVYVPDTYSRKSGVLLKQRAPVGGTFYFMRWDFHQREDFVYWPIDWTEHAWHSIDIPYDVQELHFDTHRGINSMTGGVWQIPQNALIGTKGILGDVSANSIRSYPFELLVKSGNGQIYKYTSNKPSEEGTWSTAVSAIGRTF